MHRDQLAFSVSNLHARAFGGKTHEVVLEGGYTFCALTASAA